LDDGSILPDTDMAGQMKERCTWTRPLYASLNPLL